MLNLVSGALLSVAAAPPPSEVEAAPPKDFAQIKAQPSNAEAESEASVDAVQEAVTAEEPAPPPELPGVMLPRDTPVHLMVLNEVSTKDHPLGHRFKLRVDKPVMVDGSEVVPVGAIAWGELVEASKSGNAGKSGKLAARLLYLDLDGQQIPLEGDTVASGKSGKRETMLGFLALGPLALFAKGNNAKIKAGEKMTAFTAQDWRIVDAD